MASKAEMFGALVARDPVLAFLSLPVAAVKQIGGRAVELRSKTVMLPKWTADEWVWYANVARVFGGEVLLEAGDTALQVDAQGSRRDTPLREALANLDVEMQGVTRLPPDAAPESFVVGEVYQRSVRVVIEASALLTARRAGPRLSSLLLRELPRAPRNLATFVLGLAEDAAKEVVRAAGRVGKEVFGIVGGMGLLLVLAFAWWYTRGKR